MKIGELSKKTNLSIDAIRFYEKSGLFKGPNRTEGGFRDFSADAVAAVEFISHCRSLDIPISQIKKLLNVRSGTTKSCREANQVIIEQLAMLRARIKELKKLERNLAQLQSVCNQDLNPKDCRIIQSLESFD